MCIIHAIPILHQNKQTHIFNVDNNKPHVVHKTAELFTESYQQWMIFSGLMLLLWRTCMHNPPAAVN